MEKITSIAGLEEAITALKAEQDIKGQLLKEQFYETYESLKPVNILKSTLNEFAVSPQLIYDVLRAMVSITTGYVSKKIIQHHSDSSFRKLFAFAFHSVTNQLLAQHPEIVKSFAEFFIGLFSKNKEKASD